MSTNTEIAPHWLTRNGWEIHDGSLLLVGIEPHTDDGRAFKKLLEACDNDDPQVCRARHQNILHTYLLDDERFLTAFHIYHNASQALQSGKLERINGLKVDPRAFVAWADRCKYAIPPQFDELLLKDSAVMQQRFAELDAQLTEANLRLQMLDELHDPDGDYHAPELDLALQAYRAARNDSSGTSPRARIEKWLKLAGLPLNPTAIDRITIVANWGKDPGRKRKEPKK